MKSKEAHKLTSEEIKVELDRLQRHTFDLKSQAVTEKLEDPSQLSKTKKDIARLLTEQRSRQLAAQA
ncbi:MAG: 50S ribosomal protein L29 [Phycisphaerales bacterium]